MAIVCSTLGGTLQRHTDATWRWLDGAPEPRVHDLSRDSTYNFRCRTDHGGTHIEVPRQLAENEPDLQWVLAAHDLGRYPLAASGDHTGPLALDEHGPRRMALRPGEDPLADPTVPDRHGIPIPRVILVPRADWDHWTLTATPLGAEWDSIHASAILERARALGWIDPDQHS